MFGTPLAQDAEVEPTPVRYFLENGKYYRSLSAADALSPNTLLVRLRYIGLDRETEEGTKNWPTRIGLYVMHDQMRKGTWKVIEMVPVSYERSQPSEAEDLEFCRQMLYADVSTEDARQNARQHAAQHAAQTVAEPVAQPKDRHIARKYKACRCGKRFLAKRADQQFHSKACGKRVRRKSRAKPILAGPVTANAVRGPLIPQELQRFCSCRDL